MMKLLVHILENLKPTLDENAIDRLNYFWTGLLLVFFSLVIGGFQFGGNPMTCWTPQEFPEGWDSYVDQYCFAESTYFMSFNREIFPSSKEEREKGIFNYYQYVPFMLALQAVLFYLPHAIWSSTSRDTGLNVQKIVSMAADTKNFYYEQRSRNVKIIASHIAEALAFQKTYGGSHNPTSDWLRFLGKGRGVRAMLSYLTAKLIGIGNIFLQYVLLHAFIGPGYTWWGPRILADLIRGDWWSTTAHFPRVTYCDITVRARFGDPLKYTVQCVLWINMLNEKIFLFLWFWFALVLILTIIDFLYWSIVGLIPGFNRSYIARYLRIRGILFRDQEAGELHSFLESLRPDGCFMIRLMSSNAGELITTDVVSILWLRFLKDQGLLIFSKNDISVLTSGDSKQDDPSSDTKSENSDVTLTTYNTAKQKLSSTMIKSASECDYKSIISEDEIELDAASKSDTDDQFPSQCPSENHISGTCISGNKMLDEISEPLGGSDVPIGQFNNQFLPTVSNLQRSPLFRKKQASDGLSTPGCRVEISAPMANYSETSLQTETQNHNHDTEYLTVDSSTSDKLLFNKYNSEQTPNTNELSFQQLVQQASSYILPEDLNQKRHSIAVSPSQKQVPQSEHAPSLLPRPSLQPKSLTIRSISHNPIVDQELITTLLEPIDPDDNGEIVYGHRRREAMRRRERIKVRVDGPATTLTSFLAITNDGIQDRP